MACLVDPVPIERIDGASGSRIFVIDEPISQIYFACLGVFGARFKVRWVVVRVQYDIDILSTYNWSEGCLRLSLGQRVPPPEHCHFASLHHYIHKTPALVI